MATQMLTLQEAAFISRRSAQTIRRLIKGNKIRYRRRRTPQGFNYYVEKESLLGFFDLTPRVLPEEPMEDNFLEEEKPVTEEKAAEKADPTSPEPQKSVFNAKISPLKETTETTTSATLEPNQISQNRDNILSLQTKQLQKFADTISQLIGQHHQEKTAWFNLLQGYENKVKQLEHQVKILSLPPPKKWYQFWK